MSFVALYSMVFLELITDGPDSDDEEDSPYGPGDYLLDEYERAERKNPREIRISEVRNTQLSWTRITQSNLDPTSQR